MAIGADARRAAMAVDTERLWARMMRMAEFGARDDGGVNRPCLSPEDRAARAELISWASDIGLEAFVDPGANLFLRRPGRMDAPEIFAGSHMDSQPQGGRFDGIYGVLAAFEAVEAMHREGIETERPIEIVAWTNEEGGRFSPGCTGSMSWSGARDPDDFDDITDAEGIRYADALAETLAATPDVARRPFGRRPAAFVEVHIEQGPVLERDHLDVAAVTGIQGVRWFNVDIQGETAHAGTTPLSLRKDAVQGALRAIAALNEVMADPDDVTRFTVGRFNVHPNTPNAVPDRVHFTVDFRHPDAAVLGATGDRIGDLIAAAAAPCTVSIEETLTSAPSVFADDVVGTVEDAARSLDLAVTRLPSGAFHDALFVSRVCPTGMIFVPCRNGLSHHPDEYASPDQLAAGTRVLAATLVELANSGI